ncbi:MAG: hypothetical protein JF591_01650 [Lysobacter sp.]|nr:hypothetical protein [Lysobacter sp.]
MTAQRDPDATIDSRKRVAAIERTALRVLAGLFAGIALSAAPAVSQYVVGAVLGAVLAALLAGATLGFLFGIPRALTVAMPGTDGHAGGGNGGGFTHNTNLEQISDWLTKIGAGFVLLASLLFGFIGFYIWTRTAFVYYLEHNETAVAGERRDREAAERRARQAEADAARAREQAEQAERDTLAERERKAEAERQAQQAREQAEQAARQTEEAEKQTQVAQRESDLYSRVAGYLDSGTIEPLRVLKWRDTKDWMKALEDVPFENTAEPAEGSAQSEWNSDPNLGRFGGAPIARERELSAQVQPLDEAGTTCAVTIRVRSLDPARPLTGTVTIHLHPTFHSMVREVPVVGGEAELRIVAAGVFTIGAEADGGATRLELNLATLPDLPAAFAAH